jgi:hypothetical protein
MGDLEEHGEEFGNSVSRRNGNYTSHHADHHQKDDMYSKVCTIVGKKYWKFCDRSERC